MNPPTSGPIAPHINGKSIYETVDHDLDVYDALTETATDDYLQMISDNSAAPADNIEDNIYNGRAVGLQSMRSARCSFSASRSEATRQRGHGADDTSAEGSSGVV